MTKGRLEAFSDGVFGVAITLLILDVRPEGTGTGWELLSHEWHHILIYVLSFVLVGVYWVAHHHMMHFISATNRTFLWMNLTLLLFIVFIPFVAALLSASHADTDSIRIYGGNLILINLTGSVMWSYAGFNHRLMHPGVPESFIRFVLCLHSAPILAYCVAIALASWERTASVAILVLVPAYFILPNPWRDQHIRHAMEAMHAHEKHHEPSL
jgi:uncharacterized membrane protein